MESNTKLFKFKMIKLNCATSKGIDSKTKQKETNLKLLIPQARQLLN